MKKMNIKEVIALATTELTGLVIEAEGELSAEDIKHLRLFGEYCFDLPDKTKEELDEIKECIYQTTK